jgi:hypothetical protein
LKLSQGERDELAVGIWMSIDALLPPRSIFDSEEWKAVHPVLQVILVSTRSTVLRGVLTLILQDWDRMPDVVLRVAGIRPGDSPAGAVLENLPEEDVDPALMAVFEAFRRMRGRLPEDDRRRIGTAVVWMTRTMINADSSPRSLPRDEKIVRLTNMLAFMGIDADGDWTWVEANEI